MDWNISIVGKYKVEIKEVDRRVGPGFSVISGGVWNVAQGSGEGCELCPRRPEILQVLGRWGVGL